MKDPKDEGERERKAGAFWRSGRVSPSVNPCGGGFLRTSLQGLRMLGEGRWAAGAALLGAAVRGSRIAKAAAIGIGTALSSLAIVCLFQVRQPPRAPVKRLPWLQIRARGAARRIVLPNDGLVALIPGVFSWKELAKEEALADGGPAVPARETVSGEGGAKDARPAPAGQPDPLAALDGLTVSRTAKLARASKGSYPTSPRKGGLSIAAAPGEPSPSGLRDAPAPVQNAPGGLDPARRRHAMRAIGQGAKLSRTFSSRGMGQLKFANGMSWQARLPGGSERSSSYASAAFEQQAGAPAEGIAFHESTPPQTGPTVAPPERNSSGGPIAAPDTGSAPDPGPTEDATPYQDEVDQAKDLSDSARGLKNMGMLLLVLGAALIAAGIILVCGPHYLWGLALIAAGALAAYEGTSMLSQAKDQANQAGQLGQNVSQDYGQTGQGEIVKDGADAAGRGEASRPDSWSEPSTGVKQAVEDERSASYRAGGS